VRKTYVYFRASSIQLAAIKCEAEERPELATTRAEKRTPQLMWSGRVWLPETKIESFVTYEPRLPYDDDPIIISGQMM
jgi:hypothetical protein